MLPNTFSHSQWFFRETRTGHKVAGNSNYLVCSCHSESNYYTATAQYIAVRSLVFFVKKERDSRLFPTPDRWMARLLPTIQHSTGPLTTSLWGCWGHTVVWNVKNPPEIGSLLVCFLWFHDFFQNIFQNFRFRWLLALHIHNCQTVAGISIIRRFHDFLEGFCNLVQLWAACFVYTASSTVCSCSSSSSL